MIFNLWSWLQKCCLFQSISKEEFQTVSFTSLNSSYQLTQKSKQTDWENLWIYIGFALTSNEWPAQLNIKRIYINPSFFLFILSWDTPFNFSLNFIRFFSISVFSRVGVGMQSSSLDPDESSWNSLWDMWFHPNTFLNMVFLGRILTMDENFSLNGFNPSLSIPSSKSVSLTIFKLSVSPIWSIKMVEGIVLHPLGRMVQQHISPAAKTCNSDWSRISPWKWKELVLFWQN